MTDSLEHLKAIAAYFSAERVAAFAAQIALSALVWLAAVKTKKIGCYLLAIALHAVLDAVAGVLNGYGVSVWIVEAAAWVLAGMTVWIAVILWRRGQQKGENEYEAD